MIDRRQRAVMLRSDVYNEIEQDTTATLEAFQVVLIAAAASGLGTILGFIITGGGRGQGAALTGLFIASVLITLVSGVMWAYVTHFVGTLFGGQATPGELLRTLGYAM